jgi:hypothetical protein
MTNDTKSNQILVYSAISQKLLQTLPTNGQGGASGNARGVKAYGNILAAVNNGSNNVAIFRRFGNQLTFEKLITTTSAPVSIDFANNHMYIAGATTVDSFVMFGDNVQSRDGSTALVLVGDRAPAPGSTAQVGAINNSSLLVTIKTDPIPGTVDVVSLRDGAVTSGSPKAVSAPANTLTPFGFSVYPDGTAFITLAHSNDDGLFRNGAFETFIGAASQMAPCWTTRVGKYVFTSNPGSKSISRLVGTGNNIFVDSAVAASVTTGGSADIDAAGGVLGVVDQGSGTSHITLFTYNEFGELTASGTAINAGVSNANGIAIMAPVAF